MAKAKNLEAAVEKAVAPVIKPKAKKPKVASEVKQATVTVEKKVPTTGQSAPPIELPLEMMNDKEKSLVQVLNGQGSGARVVLNLAVLGMEACGGVAETESQANSWARNSLRRLVRGKWAERTAPGMYRISTVGRKRLKGKVLFP